jgi:serine/threonine protein kinase
MPEKFTWLMFVQLYQALNFLHDTCQISHGDLYHKNVVIGYPSSNDRGLPQVKVIDFGVAESFATSKSVAWLPTKDTGMLIYLINIVIHDLPQSRYQVDEILETRLRVQAERSTHFNRFGATIQGGLTAQNKIAYLERAWEEFGTYAKSQVDRVSNESTTQIREVIDSVSYARFETIQGKIQELLTAAHTAE